MKKKISLIFGTRPEAIKMAPIVKELERRQSVDFSVCITGQHKEMLKQALEVFDVHIDYDLEVMKRGQTLSELTATLVLKIESYLDKEKPDLVLAQGDTTTVLATSLVCFYKKIPFGHVEAGLRTHNLYAPWPEEANRVLTSKISTLHFAPTSLSYETLIGEGVNKENVYLTGNTIVDALEMVTSILGNYTKEISDALPKELMESKNRIVLITGHRRENFDGGLQNISKAIKKLAEDFPDVLFVYPVHLNLVVQQTVFEEFRPFTNKNIFLLEPLSYLPFVWLMNRAEIIITDSGGIQEEAPTLGKPVLVTREVTERPEGVEAGNALLVGTSEEAIVEACTKLLTNHALYQKMSSIVNPYGDGKTARRIVDICVKYLS